jgi:hypothetical protein
MFLKKEKKQKKTTPPTMPTQKKDHTGLSFSGGF